MPHSEPPFDATDRAAAAVGSSLLAGQATLALPFALPSGLPTVPPARPGGDARAARPPSEAETWAMRLAHGLAEVLAGERPAVQLARWTTAEVHAELTRRAVLAPGPARTDRHPRVRVVIRRVRLMRPADGVAEACAVVQHAGRVRALALRIEHRRGRWRCTALAIG